MNTIEDRALLLLGSGVSSVQTAHALGVSESRISQLLSTEQFTKELVELRFQNLQKHSARDATADSIEDSLLEKLKELVPMMYNPMQVIRAYAVINAAKRRGAVAPETSTQHQTIVNINMPTVIKNRYITTNINGQVVKAGDQDLNTIQPATLLAQVQVKHEKNERLRIPESKKIASG